MLEKVDKEKRIKRKEKEQRQKEGIKFLLSSFSDGAAKTIFNLSSLKSIYV